MTLSVREFAAKMTADAAAAAAEVQSLAFWAETFELWMLQDRLAIQGTYDDLAAEVARANAATNAWRSA